MDKITKFNLPDHVNTLYEKEASSSIALTKEVANKINELIEAYNQLSQMDLEWKQTQEGTIRKAVVYMKDNLLNSLNDLMVLLRDSGFIDDRIEYHCNHLKERVENLLGTVTEGSTTLDAEVIDLRVDNNGTAHKTAGESIRNSFDVLLEHTKNIYLASVGFYNAFSNISYLGDEAYNRIANAEFFNLEHDVKVTAPFMHDVSVTVWENGSIVNDTGWCSSVVIPKGFDVRLCLRRKDDTAVKVTDIYKCICAVDTFTNDVLPLNISYTSGGSYIKTRLTSDKFEVKKPAIVEAPEGYSVALKLYKPKADNSTALYKDTGWCKSVTVPPQYICELTFKEDNNAQIFKSDLERYRFRFGNWNEPNTKLFVNEFFIYLMNSITYGGWTTDTFTYNDTTFTRMVSGIFKSDKTLVFKSLNANSKVALHLWKDEMLGANSYVSAGSWASEVIIPANRYFTLYFSGDSASAIMQLTDLECYSLTEYVEPASSGVGFADNKLIKSIAHMGYSIEAPENTLSAFKLAKQKGFEYVECDVRFTADGVPVLIHDATVDRTSNGTGAVAEMTLGQLKALDFGSWFGSKFAGEQILTLEEFLIYCKKAGLKPYLDIKITPTNEEICSMLYTIERFNMQENITFLGSPDTVNALFTYLEEKYNSVPNSRVGIVVGLEFYIDSVNISQLRKVFKEVFIDCQDYFNQNGVLDTAYDFAESNDTYPIPVEVWTVDDINTILNLDLYISGVTSNSLHAGHILATNY